MFGTSEVIDYFMGWGAGGGRGNGQLQIWPDYGHFGNLCHQPRH